MNRLKELDKTFLITRVLKELFSKGKNSNILHGSAIFQKYSSTFNQDFYKDSIKTVAHPKLSYATSLSRFHLSNDTTKDLLTKKALNCPSKLAYAFPHQGVNLTFGELKARVAIAAKNFQGKQNIEIN